MRKEFIKMKKKLLLLALTISLLAGTWSIAFAAGKAVTAYVDPQVNIIINSAKFVPYDLDSGKQMDILIYNNRTYLPVRSIGEALDAKVGWDDKTRTVYIYN